MTCAIPGCDKNHYARGMCKTCYEWARRHGETPTTADRRVARDPWCEVPGCVKPHKARGLCEACYTWWRRHGEIPQRARLGTRNPEAGWMPPARQNVSWEDWTFG